MENELELFRQSNLNPLESPHYHGALEKTSEAWQKAQTLPSEMSNESKKKVQTAIAGELAILQVAYPTQARNFTHGEIQTTCRLWGEIFGRVHPRLLHEAIQRFILEDRKGFFPAPGQIAGYIEAIISQIEASKHIQQNHEEIKWMLEGMRKEEALENHKRIMEGGQELEGNEARK